LVRTSNAFRLQNALKDIGTTGVAQSAEANRDITLGLGADSFSRSLIRQTEKEITGLVTSASYIEIPKDYKQSTITMGILFDDKITGEHTSILPLSIDKNTIL